VSIPAVDKESLLNSNSKATKDDSGAKSDLFDGLVNISQLQDRSGFSADGALILSPISQLNVDLGFFNLDFNVEDTNLVSLELPTGIKYLPDSKNLPFGISAVLAKGTNVPEKYQKLINAYRGLDFPAKAGFSNLRFGASRQQHIITFSKISLALSGESIKKLVSKQSDDEESEEPKESRTESIAKIEGAEFSIDSSTDISLNVNSVINNPLKYFSISLGSFDVSTLLDGNSLVGITMAPFTLAHGKASSDFKLKFKLSDGSNGMSEKIARIAYAYDTKTETDSIAAITGIKITPASGNAEAAIDQFSTLKIDYKVMDLMKSSTSTVPSQDDEVPMVDLSAFKLPPGANIGDAYKIAKINVQAKEGSRMVLGADVGYGNPLPITARLPYISLKAIVDDQPLGNFKINGLKLERGRGLVNPTVDAQFGKDEKLRGLVGELYKQYKESKFVTPVKVAGFEFGSPDSPNKLFSLIPYTVPLDVLVKKESTPTQDSENDIVLKTLDGSLLRVSSEKLGISAVLDNADVSFLPGDRIKIENKGSVKLPMVIEVSIPYIGIDARMDDTHAATFFTGIMISANQSTLNLQSTLAISDTEEMIDKVGGLTVSILKKLDIKEKLKAGGLKIGVSAEDNIDIFSSLFAFEKNIGEFLKSSDEPTSSNGTSIGDLFQISNLTMAALPARSVELGADAILKNPYPITLSGLGFMSASASVDTVNFVNIQIPGLTVNQGSSNLKFGAKAEFPSSPEIRAKMANFAENLNTNLGSTKEIIGASQLLFGVSADDHIKILSKAIIPFESSKLFKAEAQTSNSDSGASNSSEEFMKFFELDAEITKEKTVLANAKVPLAGPYTIQVKMPFIKAKSYVGPNQAFDFTVLNMNSNFVKDQKQILGVNSVIGVDDTPELAGNIAQIVNAVLKKQVLPGKVGVGGLSFGVSDADFVDTFSEFVIKRDLEPLAGDRLRALVSDSENPQSEPDTSNGKLIEFGGFKVQTKPGKLVSFGVDAKLGNSRKVSIKGLNHIFVSTGINGKELFKLKSSLLGGATVTQGYNNITLSGDLVFNSNPESKGMLNFLVKESTEKPGSQTSLFTAAGISFGFDEQSSFKFLSRSILAYEARKIITEDFIKQLKAKIFDSNGDQGASSSLPLKISGLDVEFTDQKTINTGIKGSLATPAGVNLDMPFFKFGTSLNQVRFFDLGLNGVKISPGNNSLALDSSMFIHDSDELSTIMEGIVAAVGKSDTSSLLNSNNLQMATKANVKTSSREAKLLKRELSDVQGTLGAGFLAFGYDNTPENIIDIFDQISIDISIQDILKRFPSTTTTPSGSDPSILEGINFSLTKFKTLPGRKIEASLAGDVKKDFGIDFNMRGLNFGSTVTGIAGSSGAVPVAVLSIVPVEGSTSINSQIYFPKSEQAVNIVGAFSRNVLQNLGKTEEKLFATGLLFGNSKENSFKFLSKAKLGIASSKVFNEETVAKWKNQGSGQSSLIPELFKVHVQAAPNGALICDTGLIVQNRTVEVEATLGFVRATALIDRKPYIFY
jgi:hypothetical protein